MISGVHKESSWSINVLVHIVKFKLSMKKKNDLPTFYLNLFDLSGDIIRIRHKK
jgi:hypothetical protein